MGPKNNGNSVHCLGRHPRTPQTSNLKRGIPRLTLDYLWLLRRVQFFEDTFDNLCALFSVVEGLFGEASRGKSWI